MLMVSTLDNKWNFIAETAEDFRAPWPQSKNNVARAMWSSGCVNLPAGTILPQTTRIAVQKDSAALYEQASIGLDESARIGTGPGIGPVDGPGRICLQRRFSSADSLTVLYDARNAELMFFRSASRAEISNDRAERCSSRSPVRLIRGSAPEASIKGA